MIIDADHNQQIKTYILHNYAIYNHYYCYQSNHTTVIHHHLIVHFTIQIIINGTLPHINIHMKSS
jgi:hypothetical protein